RVAPGWIDERRQLHRLHHVGYRFPDLLPVFSLRLARRRVRPILGSSLRLLEATLNGWMELAGLDDFGEALDRDAIAMAGQVAIDVVLEAAAGPGAGVPLDGIERHWRRIDNHCSGLAHGVERVHEDLGDLGIGRVPLVGLAKYADSGALQAITPERRSVDRTRGWFARRPERLHRRAIDCDRIGRIIANNGLENRHGILDRPGHRSGDVGEQVERHNPGAA